MAYPLARNEAERLKALHDLRILGTDNDPVLDRATALARDLFGVQTAVVSLVGEHELWFKARCGIGAEGAPREVAFCNWTVLADEVFVVEDTIACPWLKDNPLVTGAPHVRFYAGAPLSLRPGLRIGALCLIDERPRLFDEAGRRRLADLAALVVGQLRLHERNIAHAEQAKELARQQELLVQTERLAEVGGWELDLATNEVRWSRNMFRIYDLPPSETAPGIDAVRNVFGAKDQQLIRQARAEMIGGVRSSFALEAPLTTASGQVKWIRTHGHLERDEAGRPAKILGVIQDITARKAAEGDLRASEERLRLAAEATSLGVWDSDPRTGRRDWSDRMRDILGLPETLVPSRDVFLGCLHPDDRARLEHEPYPAMPAAGERRTVRIIRADNGDERWVELMGHTVLGEDGEPLRLIGTIQDVTARKQAEQAVRASEERLRLALQAGRMFAWERDLSTGHVERSANARELIGIGSGPVGQFIERIHPDDQAKVGAIARGEAEGEADGKVGSRELRYRHPDGTELWLSARSTLFQEAGKPDRLIGVTFDVTQRKAAEDEVWRIAHQDPLTGLPNRALFQTRFEQVLADAGRSGRRAALCLVDLDSFKDVNDTLGHDAGDALLVESARRLSAIDRPGCTVARLGGDEFAVICADLDDADDAVTTANAILRRLSQPFAFSDRTIAGRASIGVALYPDHHASVRELLKNADLALYRAKALGRNRVVLYAPEMREETERRVSIAREMHEALRERRVIPFYQPKVSLADGQITGFEALARWRHATRGVLTPGYFGAVFDDAELARLVGESLFGQIVSDMRSWLDAGLAFGRVAVNLAAAEFADPQLAERMLALLAQAGVPPERLEVEVTETVLLGRGTDAAAVTLGRFRAAGVRIAFDDFGTGFASLTHLKQFPVDHLKVDRSFVRDLEHDEDDAAIVAAVIGLGRSLGLEVTAEGIETGGQAERLRAWGCAHGQGYHFAKPMIASRVPWLVRQFPAAPRTLSRFTSGLR